MDRRGRGRVVVMEDWTPLPIDKPVYANADPDSVIGYQTAMENGFLNDQGVQVRFPGFIDFAELGDNGRVYLNDLNGDLIASTSKGAVYRINRAGTVFRIPGVPVSGGRRTIFSKTDRELDMAAGGPIIRLRTDKAELLSVNAPLASHVGWLDNFTIAAEVNSGRFYHSGAGTPDQWDPLDTFAADGSADNINAMIVTPFREIMLSGSASIEQFERNPGADVPFFRRWSIGEGVSLPYAMIFADNAVWTMNSQTELVRFSGQISEVVSSAIGLLLEQIDDWTDAWIGGFPDKPMHVLGQKFLLMQAPKATNPYGTKGMTFLFDYKNKRWSNLYGWDDLTGTPIRWPGWSHWRLWDRIFIGGEGRIYELKTDTFSHAGATQRWLIRTSHMVSGNQVQVKGLRLQLKRGIGSNTFDPQISVRCSRDGKPFGTRIRRGLGKAGHRVQTIEFGAYGVGSTFQFEITCSSDCDVQLIGAGVKTEAIGH
ncbi:MAG: hypothetical protein E5X35_11460 [Mesorhizobium sp.]|uniref:hypothetical protein n=3 Tax=Mesorhizobium TaxID=68287 RepID=UPI000FCB6680|nr:MULTISPECIES: hypothetical protein [unclassified Mesorhizobium]RUV65233.1 hypothetical protein EOA85_00280 [Mesorhizobium sp. M5C.F.Ca.IN.020.29.1.1]TIR33276.1 MAG: hypothetical protein E5X35_11460 [Mesorhizobium sp.]